MKQNIYSRKRELLKKVPEQFIYNYFLKCKVKSGGTYSAPYREDNHPSYTIMYFEKSGKWKARDWALEEEYHDVFEMLKRIYKLDTFEMALDILERDAEKIVMYNREKSYRANYQENRSAIPKTINNTYQTMDFTVKGERFWHRETGLLLETLDFFGVKQLKEYTNKDYHFDVSDKVTFVYEVNGTAKVYQPGTEYKFIYLKKEPGYVFGQEQLPDAEQFLVITGSEKEVMSLYELGIPAIAVESETAKLPAELMVELKSRFPYIFILYDNDKTGTIQSKQLANKHELLRLEVPKLEGVKDFTEWIASDGDAGGQLFEQMARVVEENYRSDLEEEQQNAAIYNPNEPYVLSWDTFVKPSKPFISVDGIKIGSRGNLTAIVSQHGSGKSAACELITCKLLNPESDICGIETPEKQKVFYVDTERTKEDVSNMFDRICRRLNVEKPNLPEGLELWSLIDMRDYEKKIQWIEAQLEQEDYGMLVIDGVGDLIGDVNNLQMSVEVIQDLVKIANKYNLFVLLTLHMNPTNQKGRGHAGSELMRKCEGILGSVAEEDEKGNKVFTLTTNIKHSKLRNASGKINMSFKWDSEKRMMVEHIGGIRKKEKSRAKTEKEYQEIAIRLFEPETEYTHKEAAELLAGDLGVAYDTARSNHLKKLLSHNILRQIDGKYYLNITGDEEERE